MSALDYFKLRLEATLSPVDLHRLRTEQPDRVHLIDVRIALPTGLREHIVGAHWIPQNEIAARMQDLPRDKLLVVYGWENWCSLAARSAVTLLEAGFEVKELAGGIAAWNTMGLPLDRTSPRRAG